MTADDAPLPIPGLSAPTLRAGGLSELERATRRTLEALAPHLEDRHALTCQLMIDLAAVVAASSRSGKASAAAMAAAQLMAAHTSLVESLAPGAADSDPWDELAQAIADAAAQERRETTA